RLLDHEESHPPLALLLSPLTLDLFLAPLSVADVAAPGAEQESGEEPVRHRSGQRGRPLLLLAALAIEAQDLAHQVPELTRLALRAGSRALERIQRIGAAERDREQRVDSVHLAAVLALEELLLELDLPDPVGDLVAREPVLVSALAAQLVAERLAEARLREILAAELPTSAQRRLEARQPVREFLARGFCGKPARLARNLRLDAFLEVAELRGRDPRTDAAERGSRAADVAHAGLPRLGGLLEQVLELLARQRRAVPRREQRFEALKRERAGALRRFRRREADRRNLRRDEVLARPELRELRRQRHGGHRLRWLRRYRGRQRRGRQRRHRNRLPLAGLVRHKLIRPLRPPLRERGELERRRLLLGRGRLRRDQRVHRASRGGRGRGRRGRPLRARRVLAAGRRLRERELRPGHLRQEPLLDVLPCNRGRHRPLLRPQTTTRPPGSSPKRQRDRPRV